jgi:hypothetical protein
MKKNPTIFIYIFSLTGFLSWPQLATAQNGSFFKELYVAIDIAKPVQYALNKNIFQQEISLGMLNGKKSGCFIDLGYADAYFERNNYDLDIKAPYFRGGYEKALLQENSDLLSYRVGLGTSIFTNQYLNAYVVDTISESKIMLDLDNEKLFALWAEAMLKLNVKLTKHWGMGWAIRFKLPVFFEKDKYFEPYFIPGYGKDLGGSSVGFSYFLYYTLPFSK